MLLSPRTLARAVVLAAASAASAAPGDGPLPPDEALKTFALEPGFRIDLVAAEPLVADPVEVSWDPSGSLWVVEMADYPNGADGGRVRRLEDADADGRPERSVVFASGLRFPTSLLHHERGVLVAAAPDILYLEDTDGDGAADARRVVLTGFAPGNTQLRVNSLRSGMDGWIYGANGRSGGRVRRPEDSEALLVDIGSRDFRFRPGSFAVEPVAGPSQFGLAFDDCGRRFLSWNTVHIRQAMLSPADLERHPELARTAVAAEIYAEREDPRIFPITPPPRTFNNESTRHFNASCGLTVERGGLFPAAHAGSAFTCEPLVGIIHRDRIEAGPGAARVARRGESAREFLASTDPWFHPVNVRSGPDGALYVVDFYRAMVEHPDFVPAELRGAVDWSRGHGHGRIYRVLPAGASPWPAIDLASLAPPALAATLAHPSGERRDTAQRLLLERRDQVLASFSARLALLNIVRGSGPAPPRLHALWTLSSLGLATAAEIVPLLADSDPIVRSRALEVARQSAEILADDAVVEQLWVLASDSDPEVLLATALAIGDLRPPAVRRQAAPRLAVLAARLLGDEWITAAVLSSIRGVEPQLIASLPDAGGDPSDGALDALAREAAALCAGAEDAAWTEVLAQARDAVASRPSRAFSLYDGLSATIRPSRRSHALLEPAASRAEILVRDGAPIIAAALAEVVRDNAPLRLRILAARVLAHAPYAEVRPALESLLSPRHAIEVQVAAAAALGRHRDAGVARVLLVGWRGATPPLRAAILDALALRPERIEALAQALDDEALSRQEIDLPRRDALLRAAPDGLRDRLRALLVGPTASREEVLARYRDALSKHGDAESGAKVFERACSPCHRLAERGHAVGPELVGLGAKTREDILVSILDPNRAVVPGYTAFTVVTTDGRAFTGIVLAETRTAVTIRMAGGIDEVVVRDSIASLRASAASLMPEGLESTLTLDDVRNLLEHLTRRPGPPSASPPGERE